jgi:hypothetical protein
MQVIEFTHFGCVCTDYNTIRTKLQHISARHRFEKTMLETAALETVIKSLLGFGNERQVFREGLHRYLL